MASKNAVGNGVEVPASSPLAQEAEGVGSLPIARGMMFGIIAGACLWLIGIAAIVLMV